MIASRRIASPTGPRAYRPSPSGPRWRSRSIASRARGGTAPTTPRIPHIAGRLDPAPDHEQRAAGRKRDAALDQPALAVEDPLEDAVERARPELRDRVVRPRRDTARDAREHHRRQERRDERRRLLDAEAGRAHLPDQLAPRVPAHVVRD